MPSFARVKYENIYPGIDLIYYGNEGNLEYDFNVSPGADPNQIALSVEGGDGAIIDEGGNLVLRTSVGSVIQHAPRIYQQDGAGRHEIAGGYVLRQDGRVAFDLVAYDRSKVLVIDPEVVYSTYFGGSMTNNINGLAVDAAGSVYVVGSTYAHDFPTKNPIQGENRHDQNFSAIISKLSPDGGSLVYSTYLGGSVVEFILHQRDNGTGIVLDSTGAAYITGITNSTDFPTKNPFQSTLACCGFGAPGGNLFVAKISSDGSTLVYSTYLGGNGEDFPYGIQLDSSNNAYVYGSTSSSNFPTVNPFQATFGGGSSDGFWSVISPDGAQLLFSTYVGGNDQDDIESMLVLGQTGDVYVGGVTLSSNFAGNNGTAHEYQAHFTRPTGVTSVAPSQARAGLRPNGYDLLVYQLYFMNVWEYNTLSANEELTPELTHDSHLLIPTDLGAGIMFPFGFLFHSLAESQRKGETGTEQLAGEIEALVSGACVIAPPSTTCSGLASFVIADANTLSIKNVTNSSIRIPPVSAVVRDSQDAVYVTGSIPDNPLFPLVNPTQSAGGGVDAFVTVFAPVTRQIVFSTYIGGSGDDGASGIALDPQGNIYIAGTTASPNFPTKNAYQASPPAPASITIPGGNSFIVKISSLGQIHVGPDFALALAQSTVTASRGARVPITVDISRLGGLTGSVSVTPPPSAPKGIKIQGGTVMTTGNTAAFHIKIKGNAAPGMYPIIFTGSDKAGQTHTATLNLTVQ